MVDAEALLAQIFDHDRLEPEHQADLSGGLERAHVRARIERDRSAAATDRLAALAGLLDAERRQRLAGVDGEAALEVGDALAVADHDQACHTVDGF